MIIPTCAYRIQFNPRFTFNHLAEIVDYLDDLGVTCIYASPILRPTKGSLHGYDGIDTTQLNPELGSIDELQSLTDKLSTKSISWIQDIVPNHLAFHTSNIWLNDVLERGMNSSYSGHFDIDWQHPAFRHKLMVPFLEAPLWDCLKQETVKLVFEKGIGFYFSYYDNKYPVSIETYPRLLSACLGEGYADISAAMTSLIKNIKSDHQQWLSLKNEFLKKLPDDLFQCIEERIHKLNGNKRTLHDIASSQHYVLCYFVESHQHINYRRFFNVNGLICLRIEDEKVFNDYHRYIRSLYEKKIIQGLRIDHIDGLKNPHEYIKRLRALFGKDCYIIVEKILDVKEELPASWDLQGTSGYEFLSYINQVITDRQGSERLRAIYNQYVPDNKEYADMVFNNKLSNLQSYLNGEWDNLLRLLLSLNLIEDDEIRISDLKMAMGIFMACFPVYRVYIEKLPLNINDEQLVVAAFVAASNRFPEYNYHFSILRQLFEPHPDDRINMNRLSFVQRLMQFTGPLAAKGIEDTTFYQYNALISHNEVGDQPNVLGIPVREFHEQMQRRQVKHPISFNCTSTHDTKRGEDNRIRINIISELVEEWNELVAHWQKINEPFRRQIGDIKAPVVNDEYFLYQAITGGFPEELIVTEEFRTRTKKYFVKVLRESKLMSDHIHPNTEYEDSCTDFIDHLLNPEHSYLPSLLPFVKKIIRYANTYTMVQVIIKCAAPGIPDIYQGCELWDLSYVDPDNRRPVSFDLRRRLMMELKHKEKENPAHMLEWAAVNYEKGAQKMLVTTKLLHLRRENPELFNRGAYYPIYTEGSSRNIIAFFRQFKNNWLLVALPLGIVADARKELKLVLPPEAPVNWKNIFTGELINGDVIEVRSLFHRFPLAVLIPEI